MIPQYRNIGGGRLTATRSTRTTGGAGAAGTLNREHARRRASLSISARRRLVVLRRTSEHWYEDELEYDAVREILDPKRVVVVAIGGSDGASSSSSSPPPPLRYAVAFCSKQAKDAATSTWEALGRAGPPLFLKVRVRDALTRLDDGGGDKADAAAAEDFWSELAAQNWRTELDYGLGLEANAGPVPSAEEREEPVLVVLRSAEAARRLAAHAGGGGGGGLLQEVRLAGWNQDPDPERHRALESWRELTGGARV